MGESWTHKTWFCVTKIKEIFTNYSMTTNLRHDLVPRLRLVCLGQRSSSLLQNTKTLSKLGVTKSESEFIKSKTWQNETSFCSDHNSALSSALLPLLAIFAPGGPVLGWQPVTSLSSASKSDSCSHNTKHQTPCTITFSFNLNLPSDHCLACYARTKAELFIVIL